MSQTSHASLEDFQKLEIRVGRVLAADDFPQGRHSTHVLRIDFGPELGQRKSLARLAPNYGSADLVGKQVLCVVNLAPRQIGHHVSEVLTLGVDDEAGNVVLVRPETDAPLGSRLH